MGNNNFSNETNDQIGKAIGVCWNYCSCITERIATEEFQ